MLVAVTGLFFGLRSAARARLRDLENVYFERYWDVIDKLDHRALTAQHPKGCSHRPADLDDVAGVAIIRTASVLYLRLCEDELRLRQSGLVSADTWRSWAKGMSLQLQAWPVRGEWCAICRATEAATAQLSAAGMGNSAAGGRYTLLRKYGPAKNDGAVIDPIATGWILSHWRGARRTALATWRADGRRRRAYEKHK